MAGKAMKYDVIARDLSALIDTEKPATSCPARWN